MGKGTQNRNFEQILLEAIDEAFASLGGTVKNSIYFHLEQNFAIARQDIPFRLDDFSEALERLFGLGASHLEILIMKNLHAKLGCQLPQKDASKLIAHDMTFKKYVNTLWLYLEEKEEKIDLKVIVDTGEQEQREKTADCRGKRRDKCN